MPQNSSQRYHWQISFGVYIVLKVQLSRGSGPPVCFDTAVRLQRFKLKLCQMLEAGIWTSDLEAGLMWSFIGVAWHTLKHLLNLLLYIDWWEDYIVFFLFPLFLFPSLEEKHHVPTIEDDKHILKITSKEQTVTTERQGPCGWEGGWAHIWHLSVMQWQEGNLWSTGCLYFLWIWMVSVLV